MSDPRCPHAQDHWDEHVPEYWLRCKLCDRDVVRLVSPERFLFIPCEHFAPVEHHAYVTEYIIAFCRLCNIPTVLYVKEHVVFEKGFG